MLPGKQNGGVHMSAYESLLHSGFDQRLNNSKIFAEKKM